jgi:hypothetical protein
MKIHASMRVRLTGVALSFAALACACGDGGGIAADPPAAPAPAPALLRFGAFPAAARVIGQPSFDLVQPDETPNTLTLPIGSPAVTPDGRLFVADVGAEALVAFDNYDSASAPAIGLQIPSIPISASARDGMLVFIDDNMLKIYKTAPASPAAAPESFTGDIADCSPEGLRAPRSAFLTPAGRLVVADSANHRVLIWNSVPDGLLGDADVVLGQKTMLTCAANDHDGNDAPDANPTEFTLNGPNAVWSDDKLLVVADTGNNRVLVWNNLPTTSFQPAHAVIGQGNFTEAQANMGSLNPSSISLSMPVAVDVSEAGQLAVVDQQNHRVLLWDRVPLTHAQPAEHLIGQSDFGQRESAAPSAKTLAEPDGVRFHGRNLLVVDSENHRVMVWRATD